MPGVVAAGSGRASGGAVMTPSALSSATGAASVPAIRAASVSDVPLTPTMIASAGARESLAPPGPLTVSPRSGPPGTENQSGDAAVSARR
jgi:hypothetical protein